MTPILRLRIAGKEAHITKLVGLLRTIPTVEINDVSRPYPNRDGETSRTYVTIVLSERTASK